MRYSKIAPFSFFVTAAATSLVGGTQQQLGIVNDRMLPSSPSSSSSSRRLNKTEKNAGVDALRSEVNELKNQLSTMTKEMERLASLVESMMKNQEEQQQQSELILSPRELAKAWMEYGSGDITTGYFKEDCVNAMAIALGEGIIPGSPLNYICDPASLDCETTGKGCLGLGPTAWCWEGYTTLSKFLDRPAFNINQKPYDAAVTLGPWQVTTAVNYTESINVRITEVAEYSGNICNVRCPFPYEEDEQCENPEHPDLPLTLIFDDDDGTCCERILWCGCGATEYPDASKATWGFSGRCTQGEPDFYTKYKDPEYLSIAIKICDSV